MAQFPYHKKCEDIGIPMQDKDEEAANSNSYISEYEKHESPRDAQQKKANRAGTKDALQATLDEIRKGFRVLVLMRGLPGSGKSTLAQTILQQTICCDESSARDHILSTDDYFMKNGVYNFECRKLAVAHSWNHQRANEAMSKGFSPVIIDNTNVTMCEMKPYATMATDYGYTVQILEPCTDWRFNPNELYKRNTHQVPQQTIRLMLSKYEKNVTGFKLFTAYGLQYKRLKPPQYRKYPDLTVRESHAPTAPKTSKQSSVDDILFQNGESSSLKTPVLKPMQQSLSLFDNMVAWGTNQAALTPWAMMIPMEPTEPKSPVVLLERSHEEQKPVEMNAETQTTNEDFDLLRNIDKEMMRSAIKIYQGHDRDIYPNYQPKPPGIAKKCLIEQGSQTEETDEVSVEKLSQLFPNITPQAIHYWYNHCSCDFIWTLEMFLQENAESINRIAEESAMESKDLVENPERIHRSSASSETSSESKGASQEIRKRKFGGCSAESEALKKMVEDKMVIAPEHYSKHLQKITSRSSFTPEPSHSPLDSEEFDEISDGEKDEAADLEATMELNLGEHLVKQLEQTFGDPNLILPKNFQPLVHVPVKFARQLFSFHMESVCRQMDSQKVLEDMMNEDEEMARKMQRMEELAVRPRCEPTEIPKLTKEQRQLSKRRKETEKWKEETPDTLALRLTKDKLFKLFPSVNKNRLMEILHGHNYIYKETVEALIHSAKSTMEIDLNNAKQPPIEPELISDMWIEHNSCQQEKQALQEEREEWSPMKYRQKATELVAKRKELYEKVNTHYHRGNYEIARFYTELAANLTPIFDYYNSLAATSFLDQNSRQLEDFNMLDLHFLYVKEAIPHLDIFLDRIINLMRSSEEKGGEIVQIITGRGKNSANGVAKLKPAVITRLKERGMGYVQLNPGLLKVRIKQNAKLTHEL